MLTAVFQETPPKKVVELTERRFARPTVSRTFVRVDSWCAYEMPLRYPKTLNKTLVSFT